MSKAGHKEHDCGCVESRTEWVMLCARHEAEQQEYIAASHERRSIRPLHNLDLLGDFSP